MKCVVRGVFFVAAVSVGIMDAAKPDRAKKDDAVQASVADVAAGVIVGAKAPAVNMDSAIAIARSLATTIAAKEDALARDNVVRFDLKCQVTTAFTQVFDLFSRGASKLADVVLWCQTLISGIKGPNGQQLIADIAAVQAELTVTVDILNKLSKDQSLGLTAVADAFKQALQSVKDQDAQGSLLVKQSADFAAASVDSLKALTALLVKVNSDMAKANADYITAANAKGAWIFLGGLLPIKKADW